MKDVVKGVFVFVAVASLGAAVVAHDQSFLLVTLAALVLLAS